MTAKKGKRPAYMWYSGDWLRDPLVSMLEPSSRGIWRDMLDVLHEAGDDSDGALTGTPRQLARLCRCDIAQLLEATLDLAKTRAANVTLWLVDKPADNTCITCANLEDALGYVQEMHRNGHSCPAFVTLENRRMAREIHDRKASKRRKLRQRRSGCHDNVPPDVPKMSRPLFSVSVSFSNFTTTSGLEGQNDFREGSE